MLEIMPVNRLHLLNSNMYQCGTEKCKPNHFYGPAVRDSFLIHYINEGKGIFQIGDTIYNLSKGQGFLICPGIVTFYQADSKDPWSYSWVGFRDIKAEEYLKQANLSLENPVFTYTKDDFVADCFKGMLEIQNMNKAREIRMLSLLYLFLSQLIENNDSFNLNSGMKSRKEQYVYKMVEYFELNYSRKIRISEMANHIGLDRSYMGSIFKDFFNTSPQNYLMNFRINKACELMLNSKLTIGDISRSVGYEDPLLFSKTFKKVKGTPPKKYREKYAN